MSLSWPWNFKLNHFFSYKLQASLSKQSPLWHTCLQSPASATCSKFVSLRRRSPKLPNHHFINTSCITYLFSEESRLNSALWYNTAPHYVTSSIHHLNNSDYLIAFLLPQSRSKSTFVSRDFRAARPHLWYSLPHDLKCLDAYSSFKSRLKTSFLHCP